MALGIRGANPIWMEFDLQGKLFDDTFYMFVLENTIPYIPADIYHDPDLNVVRDNPVQFLGNGTLPVDIFFESDVVYRLEFRQGPTQNDPLIYEVNDYIPGTGGSGPVDTVAFASSNQVTNPQFSLVSFSSPFTLTNVTNPDPIEIGPGWFLELTGTGNAIINQVALDSSTSNPSNAPYALRLTLSGWNEDGVVLRQRFQQNGMLWAEKIVSTAITARLQGAPQSISANLVDSNDTILAVILDPIAINSSFNEFTGYGTLPATSNPDVPPAAYIDYRLKLPTSVDIYLTSIQLVVQDLPIEPSFEQDSIDRQIDHTFHYYRDSLLMQPKDSLLSGWDFGLNPWQYSPITQTTPTSTAGAAAKCAYTADQTIIYQQEGASEVTVGQASAANKFGFLVTALGTSNKFAMIQYIDPKTINDIWGTTLSSLVKAAISTTHGSSIRFKMRLIWRTTLPSTIGNAEPILTWAFSDDPTFSAGWTEVIPKNDPVYTLTSTSNTYVFEGMSLADVIPTTDTMTLGIVIYTIDNMSNASTADSIIFNRVSLVPNEFAIDSSILTFNDTLRRLYYYFESSKNTYVQLTTDDALGALVRTCNAFTNGGNIDLFPKSFDIVYKEIKRTNSSLSFYTEGGLKDSVTIYIRNNGAQLYTDAKIVTLGWTSVNGGNKAISFKTATQTASPFYSASGAVSNSTDAYISFHYGADSRLGL